MNESLLISGIMVLCSGLMTYVIAKLVIRGQKDEILDDIEDYIASPEGQQSIYTLGVVFGKGIQQGIGLKGMTKGKKLFGIPAQIWEPLAEKYLPQLFKQGETKISEEREGTGGGKFG